MSGQIPDHGPWIRQYHSAPEGETLLVCFPHAGGSASYFYPLSAALSPVTRVVSLQYPGRQDRLSERPLPSIHALADEITGALRDLMPRRLLLFGHSMGALLAFEVARRIESARPRTTTCLVVSGARPPSHVWAPKSRPLDDATVLAEVRRLGGTDPTVLEDEQVLQMTLPALKGDFTALQDYRYAPGPPLNCPLTVLLGHADPRVGAEEAGRWREFTRAGCQLRVFPGGHFYLEHNTPQIADTLRAILATEQPPLDHAVGHGR